MASAKHQATTNSTASQQLTTKQGASAETQSSSAPATPLFELDPNPPDSEREHLKALLTDAQARLAKILAETTPTLAYYRKRQTARLAAVKVQIRDLSEAIAAKTPTA